MLEPKQPYGTLSQVGGGVLGEGKPAGCVWGVLSRIVLRAWDSHVQGEGRDGRTPPAQDTCAGHGRIGSTQANLPAGDSRQGEGRQAAPISRPLPLPERRAPGGLLGRPESGCGQWGGWSDVAGVGREPAGECRGTGRAAEAEAVPGEADSSSLHSEGQRPREAVRHSGGRR